MTLTIFELGSGMGTSAVWFADMLRTFACEGKIYSVDLEVPHLSDEKIRFIRGDLCQIELVFTHEALDLAPHPWLIIEDAHVNISGILEYFHPYLQAGDYIIVEDSELKQPEIGKFLNMHENSYRVDTHYTDFFGHNATCSPDSILTRI